MEKQIIYWKLIRETYSMSRQWNVFSQEKRVYTDLENVVTYYKESYFITVPN
jgi:hypothetical protein